MSEPRPRHAGVDRTAFTERVREATNVSIESTGHHPFLGYTPSAWRHYTRRLALLDRLSSLEFESALDVGCAEGFFMDAIARSRSCDVWGVDLSDAGVQVARARYGLPVAVAEATRLPFADDTFDLVYSTEVIEHVLDPDAMLAEMRRVARRHVVITTLVSQSTHAHAPDYEVRQEGHVNNFDLLSVQSMFGPSADIRTFRNNSTFALLTAVGRHLPAGIRDVFYRADLAFAKRWGAPDHRFKPLRNRDWLIVADAGGDAGGDGSRATAWSCPVCHGPLVGADEALRCDADGLEFPCVAPGIPDFATSSVGLAPGA